MQKQNEIVITKSMNVGNPHLIDSALVSAQHRERNYWTNFPYDQLIDEGITLNQINPEAITGAGKHGKAIPEYLKEPNGNNWKSGKMEYNPNNKVYCVTTSAGKYKSIYDDDRKITPEMAEKLQNINPGYTEINGISNTKRIKLIGNAWTIKVICNFLKYLIHEEGMGILIG